jgi:hypothetical protein
MFPFLKGTCLACLVSIPPSSVLCHILAEAVSMNSSYFAQLFGLPIPWLYDAMDPLTSAPGTGSCETVVILGHSHILYELHV